MLSMIAYIIFWFSLGILLYTYVGFICLLALMAFIRRQPILQKENGTPSVSVIICAYNEEKSIIQKIENCLALDYPQEKIEIIVVSDGSTDGTNEILKAYQHPLVRVIFMPERVGKSACQNKAAQEARNDILFFTDVTALHPPEALRILLRGLADPTVGCVTGRPVFRRDENMTSLGLGWREKYELFLRLKLNALRTLFGAQDCMYAIPKKIFLPTRSDLDSGFVGPLQLLEKGYRTVYMLDALAYIVRRPPNFQDEFERRTRIVLHGLRGLFHMRRLMNPNRYGLIAIALISSRLLRWMSPLFLLALFVSNCFLLDRGYFYVIMFLIQIILYGAALAGYYCEKKRLRGSGLLSIPFYFCMLMGAAAIAIVKLLKGETYQTWQTRR